MSTSQSLGSQSRCGRGIGPSLNKIIKNADWMKHSHVVSSCKSALDKLKIIPSSSATNPLCPLPRLSLFDFDCILQPLILTLDSAYVKIVKAALKWSFKLFSLNLVHSEIDDHGNIGDQVSGANSTSSNSILKLVQGVSKLSGIGKEATELGILRVLLAAMRSPCVLIRGDCGGASRSSILSLFFHLSLSSF